MRYLGLTTLTLLTTLSGCGSDNENSSTDPTPAIPLTTELRSSHSYEDIGDSAYWHSADGERDLLVVTLEGDGLALFSSDGVQQLVVEGIETTSADIRYDIQGPNGDSIDLLAVALPEDEAIGFYAISNDTEATLNELGRLETGFAAEGVCLYKNITTGELMVTGVSDSGSAIQYKLGFDGSEIKSTLNDDSGNPQAVRQFAVGGSLSACISDDETATLYIAEQDLGIWAYSANPENVAERQLVDSVEPLGHLQEIEGLELIYQADGKGYLLAADEGAGLLFYQRDNWALAAQLRIEGIEETKALSVAADSLWLANTELDQPVYEKLLFSSINQQSEFSAAPISNVLNHRQLTHTGVALVRSSGETQAVDDDGDAADDPAFWLNPEEPSKSLIIATNKQGGLMAYNLEGEQLQYLNEGKPNNIDLRSDIIDHNGNSITLAAASNRELNTITLYQIREATAEQSPILKLAALGDAVHSESAELQSDVDEVYGLCMYQAANGTPYVFVNGKNGQIEQWRLTPEASGIRGEKVRTLSVETQPEGCVVDDATATLYLGEEDKGIWQFNADEGADGSASLFAEIDGKQLVADVEGITLYDNGTNKYLIASSQGNHTYVVYDLNQNKRVVSTFAIIGDDSKGVDGSSETDGIHAVAINLGDAYPEGLFIAHDGYNVNSDYQQENQNFKLVNWQDISATFAP